MSLPNEPKLYESINLIPNTDGTFTRPSEFFPTVPPSTTDPTSLSLSKDIPINSSKNTRVRIFLPRNSLTDPIVPPKKLPVLIYIHGGGFVVASPDYKTFHDFCSAAASKLDVLVVTVKYRLAPEHRLPAAYEDVLEVLTWLQHGQDEWVRDYGDISSCVLMGESAGGNITYHVGLSVANKVDDFKPVVIKGLVLIQPFISGLDRCVSQIRSANDGVVSLEVLDLLWELSLPFGANRSHEYCDVIRNGGSGLVERVGDLGWWVAVVSCEGDPLYDKHVELAKFMEDRGVSVRTMFPNGGQHGVFVSGDSEKIELLDFVKGVLWP